MRIISTLILTVVLVSVSDSQTTPKKTTPAAPKPSTTTAPAKQPAASTAKPAAQSATTTPTPAASNVDPNAPVITIAGLCEPNATQADCKNTVTRAEFEKMINALNPNLPSAQRRRIAELYVQLLTLANEGRKLGAENDPAVQERMRLQRMQLFAQEAERKIQENAKPTPAEIEAFYKENGSRFEQIALRRITIPKNTTAAASEAKPAETKPAETKSSDNKAIADNIRERAAAGEDPDKLQAEVWLTTKANGAPPSTSQGMKRKGMMDPRHEAQILQLKPGEVSQVIEDGQSYYIYKVDSKQQIPLSEAEKDISAFLQQQKFQQRMQQVISTTKPTLNDAYFGPPEAEKGQPQLPPRPEAGEQPK